MARPKPQSAHQEQLPSLETPRLDSVMKPLVEGNHRIAFGRIVMPYFFGFEGTADGVVPQEEVPVSHIEAADPRKFLPHLLPGSSSGAAHVVDGIALAPSEYERIIRNPKSFADQVSNKVLSARSSDDNLTRKREVAEQAVTSALTEKFRGMTRTLHGIEAETAAIRMLRKEAKTPGYAHVSTQELQAAAGYVYGVTFPRILEVVGLQKNWTQEQAQQAKNALNHRLFFAGNKRVANWKRMLHVSDQYGSERFRLFSNRQQQVANMLVNRQVDVEQLLKFDQASS